MSFSGFIEDLSEWLNCTLRPDSCVYAGVLPCQQSRTVARMFQDETKSPLTGMRNVCPYVLAVPSVVSVLVVPWWDRCGLVCCPPNLQTRFLELSAFIETSLDSNERHVTLHS